MMQTLEKRPKIKIEMTLTDKFLEVIGWSAAVLLWAMTAVYFTHLPENIPSHFNFAGKADDYGGRFTVFLLPVIGTVLFVLLTVLNKYPHIFNYPVKITPENALKNYSMAARFIRYLKFALLLLFIFINYFTIQTAMGESSGLGIWIHVIMILFLIVPLIFYVIKAFMAK